MTKRIYNFNAGPAALPLEVLKEAQKELLSYKKTGMSVMELSHRSKDYDEIIKTAQKNVLEILGLSDDYKVLFLGGGASMQFAMIPYNFLKEGTVADYVDTGAWSTKAIKEAKKAGNIHVVASSEDKEFTYIPKDIKFDENAAYIHFTSNNTIRGTQWQTIPEVGNIPLICDMSSDFMSRKLDFSKFSLIYAGAQKNVGPAGAYIVVIKKDILERQKKVNLFTMLNYETHIKKDSMFNTPPTFPIYIIGLVMKWIKNAGGLEAIEKENEKKAGLLYDFIDNSDGFYIGTTEKESRSKMNVTFILKNRDLEAKAIEEAKTKGLIGIKGHRSVGGLRASIYNAVPYRGIEALVDFLAKFKKNNS
jgi:phosphoserine aminotransferase